MDESRLYLAPCDNPTLTQFFRQTVLEGVPEIKHPESISQTADEVLHLWGISEQKGKRYSNIDDGDFVVFYTSDRTYRYAAKIEKLEQNPVLTESIQSKFEQNDINTKPLEHWDFCICLQPPFEVDIDSGRLHDYAGHTVNKPFNFQQLNKQATETIREEFGSITKYLDSNRKEGTSNPTAQFESPQEVINYLSKEIGSTTKKFAKDVRKLYKREIPLSTMQQVLEEKYNSDESDSILSVDSVGVVRAARLIDAGYKKTSDLAETPVSELATVTEISRKAARVITDHAKELCSGENTAEEIAAKSDGSGYAETTAETRLLHVGATYIGRYNIDGSRREDFARSLQFAVDEAIKRNVDAMVQTGNLFGTKSPSATAVERCGSILRDLDEVGIPCYHVPSERELALDAIDKLASEELILPLSAQGDRVGKVSLYGFPLTESESMLRMLDDIEQLPADTHLVVTHGQIAPPLADGVAADLLTEKTDISVDGILSGGTPDPVVYNGDPIITYPGGAERLFGHYSFNNDIQCPCQVTELTIGSSIHREQVSLPVRKTETFDFELDVGATTEDVTEAITQVDVEGANVLVRLRGTAPPDGPDFEAKIQESANDAYLVSVWDKRQVDPDPEPTSQSTGSYAETDSSKTTTQSSNGSPTDGLTDANSPSKLEDDSSPSNSSFRSENSFVSDVPDTSESSTVLADDLTPERREGTCAFTVDPEEWEQEHDRDAPIDSPWDCERAPVDGSKFCHFHIPTTEREEHGLDIETVSNLFFDSVEQEGRKPKAFVGARLPGLNLSHVTLRPPDNHPIDLRMAEIDGDITLSNAQLTNRVLLDSASCDRIDSENAMLVGLSCSGTLIREGIDGRESTVDGKLSLENAQINGHCYFKGIRVSGAVEAADINVKQRTSFRNARVGKNAHFEDATFDARATFSGTIFEGMTFFQRATIGGRSSFIGTRISDRAYFREMTFEDEADFSRSHLGPDDTKFAGTTFHDRAKFDGATCGGRLAFTGVDGDYEKTKFLGTASFEMLLVEGPTRFDDVEFKHSPSFKNATFENRFIVCDATFSDPAGETARFDGMSVAGTTDFNSVRFNIPSTFVNATFQTANFSGGRFDSLNINGSTFYGSARFDDTTVEGELQLVDVQCAHTNGVPNTNGKSLSFNDATLAANANFRDLSATTADFEKTTFEADAEIKDAEFDQLNIVPDCDHNFRIDLTGTIIRCGQLAQPDNTIAIYNLEDANVGNVDLDTRPHDSGFQRYRFRNTTFDGFQFTQSRNALVASNWRIHTTTERETGEWKSADSLTGYTRHLNLLFGALANDADPKRRRQWYGDLEITYLKAKNGADGIGDSKATAEFFRRELINRRRRNWWRLRDPLFEGSRPAAGWRWLKNAVFGGIAGHGELPARVLGLSFLTILLFAAVFAALLPSGSDVNPFTLSIGSFVTLVFGSTAGVDQSLINLLAQFQGFIGAFLIALLVFTLTRSSYR